MESEIQEVRVLLVFTSNGAIIASWMKHDVGPKILEHLADQVYAICETVGIPRESVEVLVYHEDEIEVTVVRRGDASPDKP